MEVKRALQRGWVWLAVAGILAAACATQTDPGQKEPAAQRNVVGNGPKFERFRLSAKRIDVANGDSVTVSLRMSERANVWLDILDEAGARVRSMGAGVVAPGDVALTWDGQGEESAELVPGVYLYRVRARTADGHESVHGNGPIGGGEEVIPQRFSFERGSTTMSFVLPEPSRVRLHVGLHDLLLLRTLYDWAPLPAGRHDVNWDGLDSSGEFRLAQHPDVLVNAAAFSLPRNAIILANGRLPASRGPVGATRPDASYVHARHRPEACRDIPFRLDLPDAQSRDPNGVPIVSGSTPVRVVLDPSIATHLINERFEIMLFVDTVFLAEDEEGANPFTYRLDTAALSAGKHLLTANVLGYSQHGGVVSIPFIKAEP